MIHKFERLASIGKFRDYTAPGTVTFNKLTVIYADNGSGKTTLAAVLRSLRDQNPDLLRRRLSTNHTVPQAALIQQRTAPGAFTAHTLRTTGWSNPLSEIEIFDIHFVNENIYSGFDFNENQKRELHHFVVGAQGVAIKQQIEANKTLKTTTRQATDLLMAETIREVGNELSLVNIGDFIKLNPAVATNIADRIVAAQAQLDNSRANAIIQRLPSLSTLQPIPLRIDFATIISDLSTTMQVIQDATLKSIFDHHCNDLAANQINNPNHWLREGHNYLQAKSAQLTEEVNCPFCAQVVDPTSEIIQGYVLQFNDAFNALVQRTQAHLGSLRAFNAENILQQLAGAIQTNTERGAAWLTHQPSNIPPTNNVIPGTNELISQIQLAIAAVEGKIANPSVAIPIDSLSNLQSTIAAINALIVIYNDAVARFNTASNVFRNAIVTEAVALAELQLANRIQRRFLPENQARCTQLLAHKQTLKTLDTAYTALVQQEEAAATTFFNTYKTRLNYYLQTVFRTPFLVDNVAHVAPQGRATQSKLNYKLTINGEDISFDQQQALNVKECLSEGDKTTLALSFFLAKLDVDAGIANKIIVFDDPLSSLDSSRRLHTVKLIKDVFSRAKQVIVLSHREFFLSEIFKGVLPADRKALRIAVDFTTDTSRIELLDIEKLVEHEYFKNVQELEAFLVNADLLKKERILGLMRNVLEAHIRFKFYRQTAVLPENQRTFGNLITLLETQAIVFRDAANTVTIISKLRMINSVSWVPHHGDPTPDYSIIGIDPSTINVTELAGLVSDTLALIDREL